MHSCNLPFSDFDACSYIQDITVAKNEAYFFPIISGNLLFGIVYI